MNDDVCIAMEYINGDSLRYILQTSADKKQPIPLPIICQLMLEACSALHHIHTAKDNKARKLNLIHQDIGPHNMLIDQNGFLKIVDFGFTGFLRRNESTSPELLKSKLSYIAPDVFQHLDKDDLSDIGSFIIVFDHFIR